MEEQPGT